MDIQGTSTPAAPDMPQSHFGTYKSPWAPRNGKKPPSVPPPPMVHPDHHVNFARPDPEALAFRD